MSMRDRNTGLITNISSPANNGVNIGANNMVSSIGENAADVNQQYCDVMWANSMIDGNMIPASTFITQNCLAKKPFVKDGKLYRAGSLEIPMSNSRMQKMVDLYMMPPYVSHVPLMSHGLNDAAIGYARANAIDNKGGLSIAARTADKLRRSVLNVMSAI